jgi:PAS domain S-box-containing protein
MKASSPSPVSAVRSGQPDALFRAVADQAPQVMWIVNAKGAVTYLNHAWYELVGGMPPKWYGHEWGEVVHPDDLARMRDQWRIVGTKGTIFEGLRRVKAGDGTWHTLSYRATPVFDEHGLACWVGLDADVTDLVATQAALRTANVELEAFSQTVSHDLKAPLITVRSFAHVLGKLLEAHPDPRVHHYLDRMEHAAAHMGDLLDGLVVLAQVAGRDMAVGEVDVSELAAEVLEGLQRRDPDRMVDIAVESNLVVRADKRLMAVLLENLLANAWKFTRKTPAAKITVGMQSRAKGESVLFVADNGAGFDMAQATRLFTPFGRLHTSAEFPGTGIGLATVRRVMLRHGGRVWAESKPGEGSRFFFALPSGARRSVTPPSAQAPRPVKPAR